MVSRKHGPTPHYAEKVIFVARVKDSVTKVMNEYASRQSPVYAEKVGIALVSEITGYSKNSLSPMHSKGRILGAMMVGESCCLIRERFETGSVQEEDNYERTYWSFVKYYGNDRFVQSADGRIVFLDVAFCDAVSRGVVQSEADFLG